MVNPQHKLDSMVDERALDKRKDKLNMFFFNKKIKRNLSKSYSEKEATEFPRSILQKSLEEICWTNPWTIKMMRNGILPMEVDNKKNVPKT